MIIMVQYCCHSLIIMVQYCYQSMIIMVQYCCQSMIIIVWYCCHSLTVMAWYCCQSMMIMVLYCFQSLIMSSMIDHAMNLDCSASPVVTVPLCRACCRQRAGYTVNELFHLARSSAHQQRVLALSTLASIITKVSLSHRWLVVVCLLSLH